MKNVVQSEIFGEIVYEESFWTGRKNVSINGKPLTKLSKNQFRLLNESADAPASADEGTSASTETEETAKTETAETETPAVTPFAAANGSFANTASYTDVTVKGNFLSGVKLDIGGQQIQVVPVVKWYEIVLSVISFVLIMIWGNSVALCSIVPVIGGAIGGAISAMLCVVNLILIKRVSPIWLKILISLATVAVTFGICCGIGYALLAAIS